MSDAPREPVSPEQLRVVRVGHGANCSSIGSVVDALFVAATASAAIFAAVAAAMATEEINIAGRDAAADGDERDRDRDPAP